MAVLIAICEPAYGRTYEVSEPCCLLGRRPDCDIFDLFQGCDGVSRKHARIEKVGDQFVLTDLESRNGTHVNGARVSQPVVLGEGDRISICAMDFLFYHAAQPTAFGHEAQSLTRFVDPAVESTYESTLSADLPPIVGEASDRETAEARLQAILNMLGGLGQSLEIHEVLDNLLAALFRIFSQADRGFIGLREGDEVVVPAAVKHRRPDRQDRIVVSRTIMKHVMESRQAVRCADPAKEEAFARGDSVDGLQGRSIICAPLLSAGDHAAGVVQLDSVDSRHPFEHCDLEILAAVSRLVTLAMEYAHLHDRALQQKVTEVDLATAHRVQEKLLPRESPDLGGYRFFAHYKPARQVGGDYYEYVPLPNGGLAVILADASGKGVSAAIMTATLSGELKYWLARESSPAEVLIRVNHWLHHTGTDEQFVTLVLASVHPQSHRVVIANAGHYSPLLRRGGGEVLAVGSELRRLPLGVEPSEPYDEFVIELDPGDCLTFFSDGVTDAMDADENRYGVPRLHEILGGHKGDAKQLGERIVADVQRFVGSRPQIDDICLVCFGRK
jgi:serine phosphatase RsbU (regulator of sigma subunit)